MRRSLLLTALTLIGLQTAVSAEEQTPAPTFAPNSEIHLFDLSLKDGIYTLKNGRNISNNKDYDSQPYFTPKSKTVLFSASRDGKQTDIYEYEIANNQTTQLTHTEHSEFSPKPIGDTGNISFVSEGFNPYQSVWSLDRKTGEQKWLLNSKEPVGYYQLNDVTGDVLFWSRYGWSVQYLNIKNNENRFVSGNAIPSSPQKIPNSHRFSFVHRQTNGEVWIKAFDPKDFSITPIAPIFNANYDYGWAPNGDILRFENNSLSVWPLVNKSNRWQSGQALNELIQGKIGRLAISSNGKYIALVESK